MGKSKQYADVKMFKTTDNEGHLLIESNSIETTFCEVGTLTSNNNNGIVTWNSGDITHLNFTSDDFQLMYDAESNIITMTYGDLNIWLELTGLIQIIKNTGQTIEEMEEELKKREIELQKSHIEEKGE